MTDLKPWPTKEECLIALREGRGEGVRVAVLDTGVDSSHDDFADCNFAGFWEVITDGTFVKVLSTNAGDPVGHGTAVSSIIHRIAPLAEIISIRVLDVASRQRRHEVIRHGARFAIQHEAAILNCSFGVPGTVFTLPGHMEWTDEAFYQSRIVVGASSNDRVDSPEWPSHLASVVGVTAADCREEELFRRSGSPVSIAAAGVAIRVPVLGGGSKYVTGSSFAAARVSGLVARLVSCFPGLSPEIAREALHHASSELDRPSHP